MHIGCSLFNCLHISPGPQYELGNGAPGAPMEQNSPSSVGTVIEKF